MYEDADHLMMVMEYCPGQELFDVILARRHLSEAEAKPIFAQVSRALYYLHTLVSRRWFMNYITYTIPYTLYHTPYSTSSIET
ncbi:hypothetical protein EON63_04255 [archaeon]|nr:MAG: hypothetical protein EON63_04255 [archaeon]